MYGRGPSAAVPLSIPSSTLFRSAATSSSSSSLCFNLSAKSSGLSSIRCLLCNLLTMNATNPCSNTSVRHIYTTASTARHVRLRPTMSQLNGPGRCPVVR